MMNIVRKSIRFKRNIVQDKYMVFYKFKGNIVKYSTLQIFFSLEYLISPDRSLYNTRRPWKIEI